jgi:hypothetical protein
VPLGGDAAGAALRADVLETWGRARAGHASEKAAILAQQLGQLQPFVAVSPQDSKGQLASFGPA